VAAVVDDVAGEGRIPVGLGLLGAGRRGTGEQQPRAESDHGQSGPDAEGTVGQGSLSMSVAVAAATSSARRIQRSASAPAAPAATPAQPAADDAPVAGRRSTADEGAATGAGGRRGVGSGT